MAPVGVQLKVPDSKAIMKKRDAKKPRLTLSELANYDDVCTDALVDNVSSDRF